MLECGLCTCASRPCIQISTAAILACHPDLSTERLDWVAMLCELRLELIRARPIVPDAWTFSGNRAHWMLSWTGHRSATWRERFGCRKRAAASLGAACIRRLQLSALGRWVIVAFIPNVEKWSFRFSKPFFLVNGHFDFSWKSKFLTLQCRVKKFIK